MKNILKNSLLALVILSAPLASFAVQKEVSKTGMHNLPTYKVEGISALPEVEKARVNRISSKHIGTEINIKFTVNEQGRPVAVKTDQPLRSYPYANERDFAVQMIDSVRSWTFTPALDSAGNPVAVKVILPVRVIKEGRQTKALASIILDTGSKS